MLLARDAAFALFTGLDLPCADAGQGNQTDETERITMPHMFRPHHLYRYTCLGGFLLLFLLTTSGCELRDPSTPGLLVPATVDQDPSLPSLDLRDTQFYVQTLGDPNNPVLIFLHGGPGGDHRALLPLSEALGGPSLADDFFLVFWDQRGAGLSQRHDSEDITFEEYLADLEALVEHYASGRSVVLVGHSWGGAYTTMYINEHPERVAGAVLLEPGPLSHALFNQMPPRPDSNIAIGEEWFSDFVWERQFLTLEDHAELDYHLMLTLLPTEPELDFNGMPPLWRTGGVVVIELSAGTIPNGPYDFTTNLAGYQPEVLFIVGDESVDLGQDFQDVQRQSYPNSRIEILTDASHDDIVYFKADESLPLIRDYVQQIALAGGWQ